jgi:hypothetical protein
MLTVRQRNDKRGYITPGSKPDPPDRITKRPESSRMHKKSFAKRLIIS